MNNPNQKPELRMLILQALRQAHYYGSRKLKPGFRSLVGLIFVIGGVFGLAA